MVTHYPKSCEDSVLATSHVLYDIIMTLLLEDIQLQTELWHCKGLAVWQSLKFAFEDVIMFLVLPTLQDSIKQLNTYIYIAFYGTGLTNSLISSNNDIKFGGLGLIDLGTSIKLAPYSQPSVIVHSAL